MDLITHLDLSSDEVVESIDVLLDESDQLGDYLAGVVEHMIRGCMRTRHIMLDYNWGDDLDRAQRTSVLLQWRYGARRQGLWPQSSKAVESRPAT